MAFYVDTSAFLKLVVNEPETAALQSWARELDVHLFSSDLLRTEALRAARRYSSEALLLARVRLDAVALLSISREICERAAELDPGILRSLDALHLATALSLADELEGILRRTAGRSRGPARRRCGGASLSRTGGSTAFRPWQLDDFLRILMPSFRTSNSKRNAPPLKPAGVGATAASCTAHPGPRSRSPPARFGYNNTGYGLLAEVVADLWPGDRPPPRRGSSTRRSMNSP